MTGGEGLRKRGRPKGSKNRRAADLRGFIDVRYGGSAALQSAALCLVTPGELKAAGGSMAKAQVGKAIDLVNHVREGQAGQDEALRELVRLELRVLAAELANGEKVKDLVNGFIGRVKEGAARFGIREALELIAKERAALLPYTDQKQPLAVEIGKGQAPSVVIMGAAPAEAQRSLENTEVFEGVFTEVSRPKSHDDGQGPEIPQLFGPPASH